MSCEVLTAAFASVKPGMGWNDLFTTIEWEKKKRLREEKQLSCPVEDSKDSHKNTHLSDVHFKTPL